MLHSEYFERSVRLLKSELVGSKKNISDNQKWRNLGSAKSNSLRLDIVNVNFASGSMFCSLTESCNNFLWSNFFIIMSLRGLEFFLVWWCWTSKETLRINPNEWMVGWWKWLVVILKNEARQPKISMQ
jgi:hypothetical protein